MEPITIAIGGVVVVVSALVAAVSKRNKKIRELLDSNERYNVAIEGYAKTYAFEPCDTKMIGDCQKCLRSFFPEFPKGIEAKFEKCDSPEKRQQLACDIVEQLCKTMKLDDVVVELEVMDACHCGYAFQSDDGSLAIHLNVSYVYADPVQIISTICHELRHCVQFKSLDNDVWGFTDTKKAQWMYNIKNYVNLDGANIGMSYGAYRNQPIETDANEFTYAVFGKKEGE